MKSKSLLTFGFHHILWSFSELASGFSELRGHFRLLYHKPPNSILNIFWSLTTLDHSTPNNLCPVVSAGAEEIEEECGTSGFHAWNWTSCCVTHLYFKFKCNVFCLWTIGDKPTRTSATVHTRVQFSIYTTVSIFMVYVIMYRNYNIMFRF